MSGFNLAKLETLVAGHWNQEQIDLIRDQVAPKATFPELALFLQVSASRGLDPFARQIYAVHRWDRESRCEKMSIQVGIDGFRALAERTGDYAGNDDPVFVDAPDAPHPLKATSTVWRMVGGERVSFSATARWDEYKQTKKGGDLSYMWAKMPYTMLGKCAEALALRKGFPGALGGLYTPDEMGQADNVIDVTPVQTAAVNATPAKAKPAAKPRPSKIEKDLGGTLPEVKGGPVVARRPAHTLPKPGDPDPALTQILGFLPALPPDVRSIVEGELDAAANEVRGAKTTKAILADILAFRADQAAPDPLSKAIAGGGVELGDDEF